MGKAGPITRVRGGAKPGEHRADRITRQVERLFHTGSDGYGARDFLCYNDDLFGGFFQRAIGLRVIHLPREATAAGLAKSYTESNNEGAIHHAMKWAAVDWMQSEGAVDAWTEVSCMCGRADAYSAEKRWVVECGNTRMSKLSAAIHFAEPVRFTLIPYQSLFLPDDRPRRLLAVEFSWHPMLSADMDEYVAEMNRLRRSGV